MNLGKLKPAEKRALRPYLSEPTRFRIDKLWRIRPKDKYVYALILKHSHYIIPK